MADFTVSVSGDDTISVVSAPDTVSVTSPGAEAIEQFTFTYSGALTEWTGEGRLYLEGPYSVNNIRFTLAVPADRDVVLDIRKNGTSIYSAQPRIPAGEHTALANNAIDSPRFEKGDYLTLDIVQAGLAQTGQHLVANVRLKRLY